MDLMLREVTNMTDVFLNGVFVGTHKKPEKLVEKLRSLKRSAKIGPETTITYYEKKDEIQVATDAGRVLRPLIVVKNGKPQLSSKDIQQMREGKTDWNEVIESGKIEYVDAAEEENLFIALREKDLTKEHTHLEIHPVSILGVPASLVPFSNFSRGDRVNYGASKGVKQALGVYTLNYLMRFDTYSNILHYPQTPLVRTSLTDIVGFDTHPAGQNFVVAIAPWEGYNMEDAVVFNKASIERGLGRSTFFRPYKAVERRYPGGQEDIIEVPDKETVGYKTEEKYEHLGPDGITNLEMHLKGDDIVIGKTSPPRFLGSVDVFRRGIENRRESSITVRSDESGIVDQIVLTEDGQGHRLVRARLRSDRIPELGDKFSSRHGQKGVIGAIVPQEDLPFSTSGVIPDMLANPHGIPSRMTVSQLIEFLASKDACMNGDFYDGTAFSGNPMDDLRKSLEKNGFRPDGKETFYDGITGEKFEADIFQGVIYYHKLRHMVASKMHARARGPVQILTRQPTEGRSKKGGLRMGEMEKDCLVAHGAALLLKERFDSDKTAIPVCEKCGLIAIYDKNREKTYCPACGESSPITFVEMSYAFYILLNELISIGVNPRLDLEDK
jgi:DNA-directed RNA polymerase subunit B